MKKDSIIEKELGITGDYQYQALRSNNFLQANWHANKLTVVDYLFQKYQPQTVLDLGAGSGNLELAFASKVKKIVAVDYHDQAVAFLKKKVKEKMIANVQVKQINLSDTKKIETLGKFDLIIMVDVLEHLELDVSAKLITAFKKILTKHGVVVIITPNYGSMWPYIERFVDRFTHIPDLANCQHVSHFTTHNIQSPFIQKKFKNHLLGTFNLFSFIPPQKGLAAFLTKFELTSHQKWGNLLVAVFGK